MKIRIKYLDRIFIFGLVAFGFLLFAGSAWFSQTLQEKGIELVVRNLELTAAALTEAVSADLGRGEYREAWRNMQLAASGSKILAFQIAGADGTDLVGDIDAERSITTARKSMHLNRIGGPLIRSYINTAIDRVIVEVGSRDQQNTSPFRVTFLYATEDLPALIQYFRMLAIGISVLMLIAATAMFSSVRRSFLKAMNQINAKIVGIIRGEQSDLADSNNLDDYFDSLKSLRIFKEEFAVAKHSLEEQTKLAAFAQLSENLAHDLKNPLIAFDFVAQAKDWIDFQSMRDQMNRSLATIRAILGSMGNTGGATICQQNVHFDITTTAADLSLVFTESCVSVRTEGIKALTAYIDPIAANRAIGNLVRNAVEAGAKEIIIEMTINASNLSLIVSDDGPGLPLQVIANLFQRGSSYGKAGGSGIGLHNVKAIVEAHGGTVNYRYEGRTYFILLFPNAVMSLVEQDISTALPKVKQSVWQNQEDVGLLLELVDPQRTAALLAIPQLTTIPVVTNDRADLAPRLVYSDKDDITEKYTQQRVRVIFDNPEMPLDKVATLILLVYKSLSPNEEHKKEECNEKTS